MADGERARGAAEPGRDEEHGRAWGPRPRPGSDGEHALQQRLGTTDRADRFYDQQVLDHLNERMREFVQGQEMFFLATADRHGECDNSFRAGPPGFLQVLDDRTLLFPEYRGNGVHASLGNLRENPHVGLLLMDFLRARIGLHVNGGAEICEDAAVRAEYPHLPVDPVPGRRAQLWVKVHVEEAYIHCAKHIPHLQKAPKGTSRDWGTDDHRRKGGDFFGAAREARERGPAEWHPREHEPSSLPEPGEVRRPQDPPPQPGPRPPMPGAVPVAHGSPASGPQREGGQESVPAAPAVPPSVGPSAQPSAVREPAQTGSFGRRARHARPVREHQTPVAAWQAVPEPRQTPSGPPWPVTTSAEAGHGAPDTPVPESAASGGPVPDGTGGSAGAYATGPVPPGVGAAAGASAVIAARAAVPVGEDADAWRLEAERALAEAQQRAADEESATFQGWFG